jgi:hypothetical protein
MLYHRGLSRVAARQRWAFECEMERRASGDESTGYSGELLCCYLIKIYSMGGASAPGHFIHVKVDFALVCALRSGLRVVFFLFLRKV